METDLSPEEAIDIVKTIYQIQATSGNQIVKHLLLLNAKQKYLAELFGLMQPSIENR